MNGLPPVHDEGQSVHADWVGSEKGWIKNSWRRHDHKRKAKLQESVTNLRKEGEKIILQLLILIKAFMSLQGSALTSCNLMYSTLSCWANNAALHLAQSQISDLGIMLYPV